MGYFNFLIKQLIKYINKNKVFLIIFIFLIIFFFVKSSCFAVDVVYDIEQEIVYLQEYRQQNFSFFLYYPYFNNTVYWQEDLYPLIEELKFKHDLFIASYKNFTGYVEFVVYVLDSWTANTTTMNYIGTMDNTPHTITALEYFPNVNGYTDGYTKYRVRWYKDDNTGFVNNVTENQPFYVPMCVRGYRSAYLDEFIKTVFTGGDSYSNYLNSINNYLDSIDDVNGDILTTLSIISSSLSQVSQNTSTNYSQGISEISGKIDDILDDNDTIISQNQSFVQKATQIEGDLQDVNQSIQDVKNTITDSSITSGSSDLPSQNVTDPTQNGIDNIFQSIYNAFCTGQASDIVFPIPFTNKNITLSPYYVSDMLNNNNAGWVYTLIQAFWGYLIGRFIVLDVMKKITKIKSGNIEGLENSNIKGDI